MFNSRGLAWYRARSNEKGPILMQREKGARPTAEGGVQMRLLKVLPVDVMMLLVLAVAAGIAAYLIARG
jgi:hypothetical protein